MMTTALQRIVDVGVVPIIRAPTADEALRICEVLIDTGMPIVEVTFTVPGASEVIRRLRTQFPALFVGAGTVLDGPTARAAILEGAEFLISVVAPQDVIALCRQYGVAVVPGAFTPSEIMAAVAMGADLVKLFPAEVGGPGYLRSLRAPFPALRVFPTGGVSAANIREWFEAGAVAVGVGSSLIRDVAVTGDYRGLGRRAHELIEAVRMSRDGARGRGCVTS